MNMSRLPYNDEEREEIEKEKYPIRYFFKSIKKWLWELFETNKGFK